MSEFRGYFCDVNVLNKVMADIKAEYLACPISTQESRSCQPSWP